MKMLQSNVMTTKRARKGAVWNNLNRMVPHRWTWFNAMRTLMICHPNSGSLWGGWRWKQWYTWGIWGFLRLVRRDWQGLQKDYPHTCKRCSVWWCECTHIPIGKCRLQKGEKLWSLAPSSSASLLVYRLTSDDAACMINVYHFLLCGKLHCKHAT